LQALIFPFQNENERAWSLDSTGQIDEQFSRIASLPDDRIDLAHGAMLIARSAYPELDKNLYWELLDQLAARINSGMPADLDAAGIIGRINHVLFEEENFHGNREDYYDPENSFLNRVLDRRTGIPITLSILYIEVAGRLGLDVRGIGLPGHFIVALYHNSGKLFIDPYNRGEIRTETYCHQIVRNYTGQTATPDVRWLEPVGKKEILVRMLRNLKLIYARQENDVMLFKTIHWILTLQPESPAELSARAMMYEEMGNPARAVKDWERLIPTIADGETIARIRARIGNLKNQRSRIH
jgi:regulator of sirC expression with transglutaminase-like and TPR domain